MEGFLRSVPSHDAVVCSRWHLHAAPEVHIAGAVVAHHYRVGSVGLPVARFGQALHLAAFQVHLVGVAPYRIVFVGIHEDVLSALVEADESFHFILPLCHLSHHLAVGVVEIQVFVSVSHREPQKLVSLGGEDHSIHRLHISFVLFFKQHFVSCPGRHVIPLHPHAVLLSVDLRHVDVFLVWAPCYVCQIHLFFLDALVPAGLQIDLFQRQCVIHPYRDFVAFHSSHRVLYRLCLCFAGFGVHYRVAFHHALVHTVERYLRLSGRPEYSSVYAEFVAVHALAKHYVVPVAVFHQFFVHIQVAVLYLHSLVLFRLQHLLVFLHLFWRKHLRGFAVIHVCLVSSRVHHAFCPWFKDNAA